MLGLQEAVEMVVASRIFDHTWYAGLAGVEFASREEAAEHWVRQQTPGASPHPLFEPEWFYPSAKWKRDGRDPLSYYLQQAEPPDRGPHPLYNQIELGRLEDWLETHDPGELLLPPIDKAPVGDVTLMLPRGNLGRAVRWLRNLTDGSPEISVLAHPWSKASLRVLRSMTNTRPTAYITNKTVGTTVITVDPRLKPPQWPWVAPLLEALETPGVAAAQPVLLDDDWLVSAPLLTGHPVQDVERLDGHTLPEEFAGIVARKVGVEGPTVLAAHSRVAGTLPQPPYGATWAPLWHAAGFSGPGTPLKVREGRRALRWSIQVAAGAGPIGKRWGDWHFARSLADALERQGQWVSIDHPETRGRATSSMDDVVLTLRGLERVVPPAHAVSLLWVISHPDLVTDEEIADHDVAFASGTAWARSHGITPLLQCTDTSRFHPGVGTPGEEVLFVGNARGELRRVVAGALEVGLPMTVIGAGWEAYPQVTIEADRISNHDLPARYASAGVVLADHWDDMRDRGFVSNRVFDVLAVGGRLLIDDVAGLGEALGADVPIWRTPADLARMAVAPFSAWPDERARLALAERVVAEHSFDARAATLIETATTQLAARPSHV